MNFLNDDDLTTKICRFGGPLVLFICTPLVSWIAWKVVQKDVVAGIKIETKNIIGILMIILAEASFGLWMCKRGYGWFTKKRK